MTHPVEIACERSCGVVIVDEDGESASRRYANHRAMAHVDPLRRAANALADARVRYAREYARIRLLNPDWTDKRCLLAATEETNDEVTRLEAELEIARRIN